MGVRRSIILTAFACCEMVLVIEVIYTLQSTLNESHSWNKALLLNNSSTTIKSLFNCHDTNSIDSQCCNATKFDIGKFNAAFESMRMHTRPTREISYINMPLIVSLSFLLMVSILGLPIVETRLMTLRTDSIDAKGGCIRFIAYHRLLEIFAFVVWVGDAVIYLFAIVVANQVRPKFSPSPYTSYDGCKSEGQKVKFTKDEVHCFRHLKVCSNLQEDSMIAVTFLLLSALLCVVSKFNFRFCLTATDDDLLDCQHGQRPYQRHRSLPENNRHADIFIEVKSNWSQAETDQMVVPVIRLSDT